MSSTYKHVIVTCAYYSHFTENRKLYTEKTQLLGLVTAERSPLTFTKGEFTTNSQYLRRQQRKNSPGVFCFGEN